MFESLALRGLLSLMGAFLISLAVGVNYLWGIITIYGTSYFRLLGKDASLTQDRTDIVFPLMLLGQAISIPFVSRFAKKVKAGMTCFVAGIAMSFLMYFASLTQSFSNFALIFGLGNGLVIGVLYILPIGHCYQFFPRKKAMISFLIIMASGIGTAVFAYLAITTINPLNLTLGQAGRNLYYGRDIADRFPDYLRLLSGASLLLVSGGGLLLFQFPTRLEANLKQELLAVEKKDKRMGNLMNLQFVLEMEEQQEVQKNPFGNGDFNLMHMSGHFDKTQSRTYGQPNDDRFWDPLEDSFTQYKPPACEDTGEENAEVLKVDEAAQVVNECPRTSDGPRECIFWTLFLVIMLGANFGQMISVNYKTYMKTETMDDLYLTLVGAVGAIVCSFSRLIWTLTLEKDTFKAIYYCLAILNALLAFTIVYASHIREAFFAYVVLSYIVYGGHLGIFPAVASQIFGVRYGPQIYGLLFFAFPASNFLQFFVVNYVEHGYTVIFQVSGAMSVGALLLARRVELSYDWSQRIREHNERKRMMAR